MAADKTVSVTFKIDLDLWVGFISAGMDYYIAEGYPHDLNRSDLIRMAIEDATVNLKKWTEKVRKAKVKKQHKEIKTSK